MSQQAPQTLEAKNTSGRLYFDSIANYSATLSSLSTHSNSFYTITSKDNINIETYSGNLNIISDNGTLILNSNANTSNAIIIEATNSNGGILETAGSGGINLLTYSNGAINLLSHGSNINIGVSPIGTLAELQTQNVNIESFNNFSVSSGDIYFVSSDVISFISNTGDIQFGTSSNGAPIIKFENGNVLINQSTSNLDYQLDIAITHTCNNRDGYNGVVLNSTISNVAADITLQTSNTIGDGSQCILSLGSFGLDNTQAIFQKYLAYQTGNVVIRLDGPSYSPNLIDSGFGHDFLYSDIGRQIYWNDTKKIDTILSISSLIMPTSDSSNIVVSGTYIGNTSRVYLIQIDSVGTPNTFKWSNSGGANFQDIYVPLNNITPIELDSGLSVLFTATTGFSYNQQFTFQTKITAIVNDTNSIAIPEIMHTLQPFHSYIETTTPSDIVIKTNSSEKLRITGDGSISIQQKMPTAALDLNSNYNKVILVNQTVPGYQLNPTLAYLEYGGYIITWNSQDTAGATLDFNVMAQRYMSDGTKYGTNFYVNNNTLHNQSFPSVAGAKTHNSNHYIIVWASNDTTSNLYNVYCQIYHNNIPIRNYDIQLDSTNISPLTTIQLYPRCAGLYNGNYVIVWASDDSGSGVYVINGCIIGDDDDGTIIVNKFQISTASIYSRNYPYVVGLASDDTNYPNGFVVGYMAAIDSNPDPQYTISLRICNYNGSSISAEIPITGIGSSSYSNISDGLLSIAEINKHNAISSINILQDLGSFILTFYRSYQADATLYNNNDSVTGVLSGSTASISARYPIERIITLQNISNRFLISEELEILSTVVNVGNIIEKVAAIDFITTTTANITLDIGSKDVIAYCFASNIADISDAKWSLQVNTTPLYTDADRFTGNTSIYEYKRPLPSITVDNNGVALITWSNGSIPSIYYQLIDTDNGTLISSEQRLTSQYDGLKQRDQFATHLQSISGMDYGFVISWDNQSIELQDTGIYQQLIGYNHSLLNLEDGNSNLIFNHQNQLGIGTMEPQTTLHIRSVSGNLNIGNPSIPVNPCSITIQNTSDHVITNQTLQSIKFVDGSNNTLNQIQSTNSLRYDDLYPQPTNLKGFYKFDHTYGTQVVDYSSSSTFLDSNDLPVYINTNGILMNFDIEKCWTPGIINNSLLFDGVDDYVFIENTALNGLNTILETTPHSLSLSVWINIPTNIVSGASYDIVSNGGNLSLPGTYLLNLTDLSSNGSMFITSNIIVSGPVNKTINGTTKLNDSQWHHIVETINLSSISNCIINLYVDGVLEATSNTSGTITAIQHTAYKTFLGSRDGTSNFYRGYMDELRFYNSILETSEIEQLYTYGNPNLPAKAYMILNPNQNTTLYNQSIIIDDDGKINNLSCRPLPYTILTGELIVYKDTTSLLGINTQFISELTIGDIIVLDTIISNNEYVIISIIDNLNATLDRRGYPGPESSKSYQSVLRRPSIYTFFDNADAIRGHIDNYGNMMIGASKPTTMFEISGVSNSINNNSIPELSITNTTIENTQYSRKTAINFKGYDTINSLNTPISLSRIETSHYGSGIDKKGIMKVSVNDGNQLNTMLCLTSNGNIGIGGGVSGENNPLTLVHATMQNSNIECSMLLQSNYYANNVNPSCVFSEQSNIYFAGLNSITETPSTSNIKYRVLSGVSGSNDSDTIVLDGRLDFLTNNDTIANGIESRMSITHTGNVGVSILKPASLFHIAPELRVNGQLNTIISTASSGTIINLDNNIFSLILAASESNILIGGCVVVENDSLTRAKIVSINANAQLTVDTDLSLYVGYVIHIHYPGMNLNASNGFTGINTVSPGSVLSVNGSMSLPINLITTNTTLNLMYYTVICNISSNSITVSLPSNSAMLKGRIYVIKRTGTGFNLCTIDTLDTGLIDGANSYIVSSFNKVQSDGTNWWVIG